MRQRQPTNYEHIAFSQRIKHFLTEFKSRPCPNNYEHHFQYCNQYHNHDDRRRNVYKQYNFLYYPNQNCSCQQEDCQKFHNYYQYCYHPLVYKTSKCPNYNCNMGLICPFYHDSQIQMLMKYQFFKFQLDSFKTQLCPNRQQPSNVHQLASCRFYHNQSDRRRNPRKINYSHVQCSRNHCTDPNCPFAHNKIQQLYHPYRYKTKYCQSFINRKVCQYNEYCSFAHSDKEIKIELLHELPKNQAFYDFKYKTVWCPYTNQHDRGNCPYAHNFQDYRRDPKKKNYTPEICPNWTKGEIKSIEDSGCPLRMECPKSHGWLQRKYHPDLRRWGTGGDDFLEVDIPSQKQQSLKLSESKKSEGQDVFGVGAPFFKREQKEQRSRSDSKGPMKGKSKSKPARSEKQKWFNFSLYLPDHPENDENDFLKCDLAGVWKQFREGMDKEEVQKSKESPLKKTKVSKKNKIQYTKSFKQLLGTNGLYEKLVANKINQIKLLNMQHSKTDLLCAFSIQEKDQVLFCVREYKKIHKPEKVIYTDSLVRIFRHKQLLQTLQKLTKRGVSQTVFQTLTNSSIQDLSFLQENQKSCIPKILEQYADDRAFRELNTLIEKQTYLKVVKPRRMMARQCFKT